MNEINKNGYGKLRARVTTAGITVPLEGAIVTVGKFTDGGKSEENIYYVKTDASGMTDYLLLEAPPSVNSESPDPTGPAYYSYNMTVSKDGYFTVKNIGIPIFDGISSLQPVVMIPLSADYTGENMIVKYEDYGYEKLGNGNEGNHE